MSLKPTPSERDDAAWDPQAELTLDAVSQACAVQTTFILELVEEGAIALPAGQEPGSWRFTSLQLHQVMVAARLQRDLGINLAGAALVLQLLDDIETLRAQITTNHQATQAGQD